MRTGEEVCVDCGHELCVCETPMQISDHTLAGGTAMPTTQELYLSAISYDGTVWFAGPSGCTRNDLINSLVIWKNVTRVRIYKLELPRTGVPTT